MNDYPILAPPSIDLRTFQAILTSAGSPAAGEAPAIYTAAMRYGVDPAVILAIAQHESSFGKAGIAVGRHNLFGSRYYAGTAAFGATNRGGWASFPSYAASAAYTASLLASKSYAGAGYTARTFPQRYAPSSDGNNPRAYGTSIVNAINRWTGSPMATPSRTGPATKAASAAKAAKASASKVAAKVAPKATTPAPGGLPPTLVWGFAIVALAAILLLMLAPRG